MSLGNVIQELLVRIRYVNDETGLKNTARSINKISRLLTGISVGAGLYMIGRTALKTASDLEAAEAQFTTMLGSSGEAKKAMKDMWEYAAISTFEMADVTKSMTTMLSHGMKLSEAEDTMRRLGDVAGASAPRFQRLSLAMAQMALKGRLTGEELRQFVNAGWNPLREIANKDFGGNMEEAEEAMRKHRVSAEAVFAALKKSTDQGGMFFQNQLRQSQTLVGVYTTMKDRLKKMLSDMIMGISPQIKSIMRWIGELDFTPLVEVFRLLVGSVQYLMAVIWESGLREGWIALAEAIGMTKEAAGDSGLEALGSVLKLIGSIVGSVAGAILKLAAVIMRVLLPVWLFLLPVIRELGYALHGVWDILVVGVQVIGSILLALSALSVMVGGLFMALSAISGAWGGFMVFLASVGGGLSGIVAVLSALLGLLPLLLPWIVSILGPLGVWAAAFLAIGWAVQRITNAVKEKERRQEQEQEDAARGSVEDELNKRSALLDKAKKRGDKKEIERAERHWSAMNNAYTNTYLNKKKTPEEETGIPDFKALVSMQGQGSEASVQKMVTSGKHTTNINNKVDFKVDVKGDKNAKTGLSAGEVAFLAERAARSTFGLALEQALEGTF